MPRGWKRKIIEFVPQNWIPNSSSEDEYHGDQVREQPPLGEVHVAREVDPVVAEHLQNLQDYLDEIQEAEAQDAHEVLDGHEVQDDHDDGKANI